MWQESWWQPFLFLLHFVAQGGPPWNQIIVGILIVIEVGWSVSKMQGQHEHG